MSNLALPVIDKTRTEFGYYRTICSCPDCTAGCRYLPAYLIPADLERMHTDLDPGEDLLSWARKHLLASPGALVVRRGKAFRIPTLVPARQADGACIFLTSEGRCGVHAVAPFGCSFFDTHMSDQEANLRSSTGLRAVLEV
jgi:Fe-S-cluster containining protein